MHVQKNTTDYLLLLMNKTRKLYNFVKCVPQINNSINYYSNMYDENVRFLF